MGKVIAPLPLKPIAFCERQPDLYKLNCESMPQVRHKYRCMREFAKTVAGNARVRKELTGADCMAITAPCQGRCKVREELDIPYLETTVTGQEKVLWPLGTFGAGVQRDFLLA